MAYPMSLAQGYLRTPTATKESRGTAFAHDGFAHDGADGCSRVRPHSGFDASPTVVNATAISVLPGRVTRTGYTKYAGNFVEILSTDGRLWLYIHLHSIAVGIGPVNEGQGIGIIGNTGGGGALGANKMFVHLHVSRCDNTEAANRILNGLVYGRNKNETPAQWAARYGLSDPWPIIRESVTKQDAPKPETPALEEEDIMRVYANTKTNAWAVVGGGKFLPIVGSAGLALCRATGQITKDGQANPDRLSDAEFNDLQKTYRA